MGGGEIKVSDIRAIVENDFHNTNNLRTSIETIQGYSLSRIKVPTYHITLQDIYNGINKEEAMPYAKAYFFNRISKIDTLMQYILFGEVIYT